MTDKELLELAAKAAGIELRIYEGMIVEPGTDLVSVNAKTGFKWNPQTDDGDALRLAVKLGLWIYMSGNHTDVMTDVAKPIEIFMTEPYGDDPYAATRRAIFRAAAEIGRTMG